MNRSLTLFERAILESLVRSDKTLDQLSIDIDLDVSVVERILNLMLELNFISDLGGVFGIRGDNFDEIRKVSGKAQVIQEFSDLLTGAVVSHFDSFGSDDVQRLSVKKVSMTSGEIRIYNAFLTRLEEFIDGVEKRNNRNSKVADQQLVFFGNSNYSSLIKGSLSI